jgi:hypothetical protein
MKKIFSLLLLVIGAMATGYGQSNDDSTAIIKVLEKESATWRAGDLKGHADCWYIRPYSRILVSTGDSLVHDVPPQMMIDPPATSVGRGGSSINSNYKMSINGTSAWVSHDEISTSKEGKKHYSYEFRMLEKIDGQWKLVGQSIHVYRPKTN